MAKALSNAEIGSTTRDGLGACLLSLGVFATLAFGAAALGGMATSSSVTDWYPTLAKPSWTPDGRVIGMVWSVLYPLIALAGFLGWLGRRRASGGARGFLTMWCVQMALNAAWSFLFFGLRSPGAGLLGIVLLALAIGGTIAAGVRVSRAASLVLVPYLAWVCFAGFLNFRIWQLN